VDLVKDPLTREPAIAQRQEILERCFQKGLLLLGCGESAVRFSPPLIVNRKEIEIALEIFDEILTEVENDSF
jgi:4-aminobutyrate aminotransferase